MTGQPGTYALLLQATRRTVIQVGRLGRLDVRRGFYVYVGSALGPGGVSARVSRHLSDHKRRRWHVDYLMDVAQIKEVWYTHSMKRREHEWAEALARFPGGSVPIRGFGSSDCACPAHLYYFRTRPSAGMFAVESGDREHPREMTPVYDTTAQQTKVVSVRIQ